MSELIPTKPYMVRAIHEWCVDNGMTPHLLVAVNSKCRVPMAYVKDGEIVLNLNYSATKDLLIDNDAIVFSARFGGVSQHLHVPMNAVKGIFARENGQGMFFEIEAGSASQSKEEKPALVVATPDTNNEALPQQSLKNPSAKPSDKKKPTLTIVK
jgi:stringent starvation protein B